MAVTPPLSFTWAEVVDRLVAERGSLAEVVRVVYDRAPGELPSDPSTVERGLRRLRQRGAQSGERYGRLLLRTFGLPASIAAWAQALGTYHGPLNDLPLANRRELLELWDRPPLAESDHAVWIHLALASVAHHDGRLDDADRRLELAALGMGRAGPAARLEWALFSARRLAHQRRIPEAIARLENVEETIDEVEEPDGSCYRARWLDQRAYLAARGWRTHPQALERSAAFREAIPDGPHSFVAFRRHLGLAWIRWRQGSKELAVDHGQRALSIAGDAGRLRLRATALRLLARLIPERRRTLDARAQAILEQLDGRS
ncbi:MAG: hypothetical protein AAGA48_15740 [Myxococcota bacterium]